MGQPIDSHPATQPHKAVLTGAVHQLHLPCGRSSIHLALTPILTQPPNCPRFGNHLLEPLDGVDSSSKVSSEPKGASVFIQLA
jgi:hypothetical protein